MFPGELSSLNNAQQTEFVEMFKSLIVRTTGIAPAAILSVELHAGSLVRGFIVHLRRIILVHVLSKTIVRAQSADILCIA